VVKKQSKEDEDNLGGKEKVNAIFVQRFNSDPIFAFDSLLEVFYSIW
jgi:hypothetical protein